MIDLTYDSLMKFIQENGYSPKVQNETSQIVVPLKGKQQEFPLFLKIKGDKQFLQSVTFLPPKIKKETYGDVARILHFFNREIDFPGFGLDEAHEIAFYRLMFPATNQQIDPTVVIRMLEASESACSGFLNALQTIASGTKTVEQFLLMEEEEKSKQSK